MSMRERVYKYTDKPMTWTRAIIFGSLIDFTTRIPGVNDAGLNPKQIAMVRDIIANTVQIGALVVMLGAAYFWQKSKQKRTGARGLQDPVKGYMSGKWGHAQTARTAQDGDHP